MTNFKFLPRNNAPREKQCPRQICADSKRCDKLYLDSNPGLLVHMARSLSAFIAKLREISLCSRKHAKRRGCLQFSTGKNYGQVGGVVGYLPTMCRGQGEAMVGKCSKGVTLRRIFTLANPTPGLQCPLQALLGNAREICRQ